MRVRPIPVLVAVAALCALTIALLDPGAGRPAPGPGESPRSSAPADPGTSPRPAPPPEEASAESRRTVPAGAGEGAPPSEDPGASESPRGAAGGPARLVVRLQPPEVGGAVDDVRVWLEAAVPGEAGTEQVTDQAQVTDGTGHAEFGVPARVDVALQVQPPGATARLVVAPLRLEPGEVREVRVSLAGAGRPLVVRVVEAQGGAPIPGARLRFESPRSTRAAGEGRGWAPHRVEVRPGGVTGADGLLETSAPPLQRLSGVVEAAGFGRALFPVDEARGAAPLLVELLRGATLKGRVGGPGSAGARVELTTDGESLQVSGAAPGVSALEQHWSTALAPDGHFELRDLPPHVGLEARVVRRERTLRREPAPLHLRPGEELAVEWVLGSGASVRGTLRYADDASPLADTEVWLLGRTPGSSAYLEGHRRPVERVRSDRDGRFAFEDAPPGSWWVGPAPSSLYTPLATPLTVGPGDSAVDVTVDVPRALLLQGTVLDAAGNAVQASVVVQAKAGAFTLVDPTQDGRFSVGPVPPGEYRIFALGHDDAGARSEIVTARAGEDGIVLRLPSAGAVRGHVVDGATGEPVPAAVSVLRQDETKNVRGKRAGDDGAFHLGGLAPGSYRVIARADRRVGQAVDVLVDPGATVEGLRIALEEGAVLEVRYSGGAERAWYEVRAGEAFLHVDSVAEGTARVVLPPGTVSVTLGTPHPDGPRTSGPRTVDLVGGRTTAVEFAD